MLQKLIWVRENRVLYAQTVLICGWQDTPFMLELLTDLDRGNNKLPRGSEIVLMNLHEGDDIARHTKRLGRCRIAIRHVMANPLHRESFKKVGFPSPSGFWPPLAIATVLVSLEPSAPEEDLRHWHGNDHFKL